MTLLHYKLKWKSPRFSLVQNGINLEVGLTLRGLSLFFKILPISNTGVSIAYILATVDFLYPKLGSFSDMEYYFYQLAYQDSKFPKRFVGLNQMQCSPSFDWNWGKQNDPTACWRQLHPRFRVLQQGKCLRYPPERVGRVTETTNCVGGDYLKDPTLDAESNPLEWWNVHAVGFPTLAMLTKKYLCQ